MDYSSIGKQIRERRTELKMTQEKLAEAAELSVSYMGAVERGEKLPSMETFIRLANVLETSSDRLLSGVLTVGNKIVASKLSSELSSLPEKEQKRILNVVRIMINDSRE